MHNDKTLKNIASVYLDMQEAKDKSSEELDPVGQADADIDNDGDVDSSDEYLKKRRKKISKSVKDDESVDLEEAFTSAVMIPKKTVEVHSKLRNLISMFIKKRKMKMDVDGDNYHYDSTDRKVMKDFEKELRSMGINYDMSEAVDQTPSTAAKKETSDDKVSGKAAKDFVAKHKKSDPKIEDDAEEGIESASKAGKVTKQAPKN
jgi:hypothetical protein